MTNFSLNDDSNKTMRDPLKIAIVVGSFPNLSETFIINQIIGLIKAGHAVDIYARYDPNYDKIHPLVKSMNLTKCVTYWGPPNNKIVRTLRFIQYFFKNKRHLKLMLKTLNIFKYKRSAYNLSMFFFSVVFFDKKYDVAHCHFGHYGALGTFLKDNNLCKILVTSFHGLDFTTIPKLYGSKFYNHLFKVGDVFLANTNFTKNKIINLGCPSNNISILPVGVDINLFKYKPRRIYTNSAVKILMVGRFVEKKGHIFLINAIINLINLGFSMETTFAGDGPLFLNMNKYINEHGFSEYFIFLGGVTQDRIINLYENCHIFILPSITASNGDMEGQGLVLQEAQACGIPVISTIHNGIPEGLLNNVSGYLVEEKSSQQLEQTLLKLIYRSDSWPEMGRKGANFVSGKYDINKLNKKLISIYYDYI